MPIQELLTKYGGLAFEELTKLLNYIFEYRNAEYEPLTREWVEENISLRQMGVIIEELADLNQLGWVVPFFRKSLASSLSTLSQMEETAEPRTIKTETVNPGGGKHPGRRHTTR
ncbi:MAG: hypothetical protein WC683_03995 [bacterium]